MNSCARKRNHAYEFMPFEENAQNEIHTARTKSHRITATSTPRVQLIQRTVQPTARTHTSTRTMRAYTRQSCTHIHASLARECDTISCILNGRAHFDRPRLSLQWQSSTSASRPLHCPRCCCCCCCGCSYHYCSYSCCHHCAVHSIPTVQLT